MGFSDAAATIDALLRASHREYPAPQVFERDTTLDRRIASAIAVLAAGGTIHYVSIDQSRAPEHGYIEIDAFTSERVIRAIVSHGYLTALTINRDTLRSIEMVASPDYLAPTADEALAAVASYAEITARLPGDELATEENLASLREFFPSLLADL